MLEKIDQYTPIQKVIVLIGKKEYMKEIEVITMEQCSVLGCWYNKNGDCICCDDCHDTDLKEECVSYDEK